MKRMLAICLAAFFIQSVNAQTGLQPVQENNKYGYKSTNNTYGSFIIPPKYDDAHYFFEGLAAVRVGDNWGFIDPNGTMKIQPQYSTVGDFYEGLSQVSKEVKENGKTYDKFGFINKSGAVVIPLKFYASGGGFEEGLCNVAIKDAQGKIKWGFINKTGAMAVPAKYDSMGTSSGNGFLVVYLNGKAGFVNKKGVEVIPPTYGFELGSGVNTFINGTAVVLLNGKKGVINETGKVVIPFKYDYIDAFREDLAIVALNGKYGYINASGTEVIPLQYKKAGYFNGGLAIVWTEEGEQWQIDKTGKQVKLMFKPELMDSTVFSGEYNDKKPTLSFRYSCQSNALMVIVEAGGKAHKFPGTSGIIDLRRMGIKKGEKITVTVKNRKGCTVTMAPGGAIR